MASISIASVLKALHLKSTSVPWDDEAIERQLWEASVTWPTIRRFLEFVGPEKKPDEAVTYGDTAPPEALTQLDTANYLAKLLKFIDSLEITESECVWKDELMQGEIESLGTAAVMLIELYSRDLYCDIYRSETAESNDVPDTDP